MAVAELRRSFGSERYVSDIQRGRLLSATFALVGEAGFEGVNVRRVSERAGVSNRTFYESFADREDCFLAVFNYAVEGLESEARVGWESEPGWVAGVRAALALLLRALDRALAAVAGRPGLNNREVSEVIGLSDQGQISRMMRRLSEQGLVENAQGHVNRQVKAWRLTADGEAVIDTHGSLKQARRRAGKGGKLTAKGGGRRGTHRKIPGGSVEAGFRLTALTHEVLAVVGQGTNPSNREVAQAAGVKDQGQISKLLARLETHGLLANNGGVPGVVNAWQLTSRGEDLLSASSPPIEGAGR